MFRYSFNNTCTLMDSSRFSFKNVKMKEFLEDVLHPLDNKHMGCKWSDIKKKAHFHKIPEYKIEKTCPAILARANGEQLYQLDIKGGARIVGFISEDIFYIVAYDKNHEIYDMS